MTHVRPSGTLLICEGEIDCCSFVQAGFYQTVSVPLGAQNFKWIEENWDFLQGFDTIIIAGDNDKAGQKMMKEACARLSFTNVKYIEYPKECIEYDENHVFKKSTKTKDANDVLQLFGESYLFNLVLNAKETPIESVIKMSNVEDMNINEMDGIEVGIKRLDDELIKIFCGGVTIVTGKASAGKTTFLNQIALSAMDQEMPVFLFSRELLNSMSKDWYKTVGAGIRNMHEVEYTDKRTGKTRTFWVVNQEAKKQMDDHYKDMLYVYRDEASNEASELISTMEQLARRRGVKCFLIDNLMTVLLPEDKDGGVNGAQTKFISELTKFSMKYNAIVVLVAHPRKTQSGQEIGLDDVAGSMNIVNLAVRTIGLRRVTDKEKEDENNKYHNYDVIITSVKDRIFGSTAEVPCHYSKPTRRFFSNPDEWERQYGWDTKVYKDKLPYCDEKGNEWVDGDEQPFE
jgi:twinkle protein